jgi:hypothetical protein
MIFFGYYYSKGLCYYYYDRVIEGFYCVKSENFNENTLKTFPTLYLEHNQLNYTFKLTYLDLFVEKDGKYWFLIGVKNSYSNDWYLGYPFLRKYQFAFNQDAKSISFYNQDSKEEDSETNKDSKDKDANNKLNKNLTYIVLIVLSWIVFILLGFLLGRYLCKKYKEKKRANELDDDYEYINEKKENIN